jgi:nitrite reductase/ring-hydroxylating ferredoxin subunit
MLERGASFDTGIAPRELDPERPRLVETPWGAMALFLAAGEAYCVQAFCPHLEGPLFQGSVAGTRVTCPWHAWTFDLRTGERVGPFPWLVRRGSDRLRRCAVSLGEGGTIVLAPIPAD